MAATTTLKLSEELKARISALAKAEGKTPHAYMVETLERQAERAERRREYLAAGDASLREYQRTGIAYAMEDVEQYILGKVEGKKASRPKPVKPAKRS
jgi:predicted transcriptional regulator